LVLSYGVYSYNNSDNYNYTNKKTEAKGKEAKAKWGKGN
jgi:hypothetical protein